jgi:hypothetical protein
MRLWLWSIALLLNAQPNPWLFGDRPFRMAVHVEVAAANSPVTVPFDPGAFDPDSIAVGLRGAEVPAQISESVEAGRAGTVSWLVTSPGDRDYFIYYDLPRSERRPARDRREPIGGGDAFFHNRPNGFDHLGVGMKNDQPMAVDWDGDGRTDILQRNIYSSTYGESWWGVYFWRNIGTNAAPRFDRYRRLASDGRWIDDLYGAYQLYDADHDGQLDLLCGIGGGPQRGELKVYRNTGRRDAWGLPVLTAGETLPKPQGGELSYGMRLLDWAGRGLMDLFTLRSKVEYFPKQQVDYTLYRHAGIKGAPEAIPLAGETTYADWPSDRFDVNGDGLTDLIGSTRGLNEPSLHTCLVAWLNTGTATSPAFAQPAQCVFDTSPEGFAVPTVAKPWPGLLLSYQGSWLRHLDFKNGRFTDQGPWLAKGMPVSFGGYSSVDAVDYDGDGDLDFVAGNEVGYIQLVENISQGGRSMFRTARHIVLTDGKPMYAGRWQFIQDADPERPFGQAKPALVDWDGDGDLDILAGNNSNRIAYFENVGTRQRPRYAPLQRLLHEGGEYFSFRAQPAPVDWNGDGLPDLVAGSSAGRDRNDGKDIAVSLYLRYRAADGSLRLKAGVPLRLTNGAELRTPIPYHHGFEVVDWDGVGDLDLFSNEKSHVVLYRNMGKGLSREVMAYYGKPLTVSHHETSVSAVDWDHDGRLDLVLGGESGWVYFFRRSGLDATSPPLIRVGATGKRSSSTPTNARRDKT